MWILVDKNNPKDILIKDIDFSICIEKIYKFFDKVYEHTNINMIKRFEFFDEKNALGLGCCKFMFKFTDGNFVYPFLMYKEDNNEQWISVKDELPIQILHGGGSELVLASPLNIKENNFQILRYNNIRKYWYYTNGNQFYWDKITHWKHIHPPYTK